MTGNHERDIERGGKDSRSLLTFVFFFCEEGCVSSCIDKVIGGVQQGGREQHSPTQLAFSGSFPALFRAGCRESL